jgi:hypothetical protein
MALVYFPSPARFVDAWSEPQIVHDAFPLRKRMLADGFRHVWIRCGARPPSPKPTDDAAAAGASQLAFGPRLLGALVIVGVVAVNVWTATSGDGHAGAVTSHGRLKRWTER